uniref:Cystinosin homolog n=1 Tax=Tanacetum cinerariifolium TaxID=118510 RepID=A0A6L2KN74_TANCI|nr:cystinosin homolog [Tanacetum cinerariifolium]
MMGSWNSMEMEVLSLTFGWIAFFASSFCFYPQVILNFKRKSVIGLNQDFVVLNLTKHSSYLIYNAAVYFSSDVQFQYHQKYGFDQMIPLAANDVAISIHAVLLTAFTLFQIAIYDRGSQKVSKISILIVSAVWLSAIVCVFIAIPNHSWLWLVSCFSTIQVVMTVIKYIPQAVMNFQRKSTTGFSIGYILLDLLGGSSNYAQMTVQSVDQHSWMNFYGNIGKTLLLTVSTFFDFVFISQHYVLSPVKKTIKSPNPDLVTQEPLVTSSEEPTREDSLIEVAAPPPKSKSKPTRGRQKMIGQNEEAPRQISWTTKEEIVLCKGWVHICESNKLGNTRKYARSWTEVLEYIESKTKHYGRRTYNMVNEKWKTVRTNVVQFCGLYANGMRMVQESKVRNEDYFNWALLDNEAETGVPFKLRHCLVVLKCSPKWMQSEAPNFLAKSRV